MKIPRDTLFDFLRHVEEVIAKEISIAFKSVLENKHLYQNFDIKIPNLEGITKTYAGVVNFLATNVKEESSKILSRIWDDINNTQDLTLGADRNTIYYRLPTVKIYCVNCKRIEPFNPIKSFDLLRIHQDPLYLIHSEQLFILIYQCQSCKKLPEVFLIRRKGWKLNIAGRSPIETIQTKADIPKEFATYISNAKLAFNSGQTLAGLFFLRVFIEQYTNKVIGEKSLMVDEIIKKYMEGLPNDFKERQPSLAKTYEDLSAAIHNADSNEELFSKSLDDIERHFEAKRIYKV